MTKNNEKQVCWALAGLDEKMDVLSVQQKKPCKAIGMGGVVMKYLTIILSIIVTLGVTQQGQAQGYEISFGNFLKNADMVFKMPENFQEVAFEKSHIVIHPNYIAGTILKQIANTKQDVLVALAIVPFTLTGEKFVKENEVPKCIMPLEYDITKGTLRSVNTKKYRADIGSAYPVRVFKEYLDAPLKKYDQCYKVEFINYKKGRALAYFFYNNENEYVKNLISHFYDYFRFQE